MQEYSYLLILQVLYANAIQQRMQEVCLVIIEYNVVIDEATGIVQEYRHLMCTPARKVWETVLANDLGRLV